MLGVRGFPPLLSPPLVRKRATDTYHIISLLSQRQPLKPSLFLFPLGRNGFYLFSGNKHHKLSLSRVEVGGAEIASFDEFDIDFDDDEEESDDEENDVVVPYHKMNAWLKNKPSGFGEGKVYDTSIEDKLMEEIEQSRKAQLANVSRLKNESKEVNSQKELKKEVKASDAVPAGIRVRINNLPKKKNVHRDLKTAFEGVCGIIEISPVVAGNKKTRDPVCKGFGFVDFKSMEDANRFVQMFSGQNIEFGKIEKRIKCEIVRSYDTDDKGSLQNGYKTMSTSRSSVKDKGVQDPDKEQLELPLHFREDDNFDESDDEFDDEDISNSFESLSASDKEDSKVTQLEVKLMSKTKAIRKNSVAKKNSGMIPSELGLTVSEDEGDLVSGSENSDSLLQFWEDDAYDEYDEELDDEDIVDSFESLSDSGEQNTNMTQLEMNMNKTMSANKNTVAKKNSKIPKLHDPGSAKNTSESRVPVSEDEDDYEEFDEEIDHEDFIETFGSLSESVEENSKIRQLEMRLINKIKTAMNNEVAKKKSAKSGKLNLPKSTKTTSKSRVTVSKDKDEFDEELDDEVILDSSGLLSDSEEEKRNVTQLEMKSMNKGKSSKKKSVAKQKNSKNPKLNVPGSAKRLKIREKAKLADVFSRYGSKEALVSKEM